MNTDTDATLTSYTITDEQISSLREEAASAGDLAQVAICDMAQSRALGALGARAECARVIRDAQGAS